MIKKIQYFQLVNLLRGDNSSHLMQKLDQQYKFLQSLLCFNIFQFFNSFMLNIIHWVVGRSNLKCVLLYLNYLVWYGVSDRDLMSQFCLPNSKVLKTEHQIVETTLKYSTVLTTRLKSNTHCSASICVHCVNKKFIFPRSAV